MDTLLSLASQVLPMLGEVPGYGWTLLTLAWEHPGRTALIALGLYATAIWRDAYWREQLLRGGTRFLNGALRGQGDVSFSAWSYEMQRAGSRFGALRVRLIDGFRRDPGHCQRAWEWASEPRRALDIEADSGV